MENKEEKLQEHQAPLKNTDHAFVQVGKDGEPQFPTGEKDGLKDNKENKEAAAAAKK